MPHSLSLRSSHADVAARLRTAGCVFAEEEARLLLSAADTPADLTAMVQQRIMGLPLEHVLGWAEFCGLRVGVDPGVFVPRARTELLVHEASALTRRGAVVVDLCCGSAALGLAVAAMGSEVQLHVADIDAAAVRCARRNVADAGRVHEGDLFTALPTALRSRVDVLLANVPYVPTAAIALLPAEARVHESRVALDGGHDGLDVLRRVAGEAAEWLAAGGHVLMETSRRQARLAADVLAQHGLEPRIATSDEHDATVVIGGFRAAQAPRH